MMSLEGKIFVLDDFVNNFRNDLTKRETIDRDLISSISVFRDLSKMEKGDNLYTTGYSYRFRTSDLKEEIDIILSKEYCLTLSQAYEVFETYLIELYTELLLFFPEHLVTLKVLSTKLHLPKTSLKEYIKEKIGREKNNRKFINSSRKLSKHFTQHETKNIYNINISTWFDLVSELRHNIVHQINYYFF